LYFMMNLQYPKQATCGRAFNQLSLIYQWFNR
jgi:hypothetical protein